MAQPIKSAEVKSYYGRPTLFVNNTPQVPAFYALTHAYGGRWSWEEVPARNLHNFCSAGIRLFQVDLWFEDMWLPDRDTLDIGLAKRQVQGVLAQCPDAGIVIRIHVNAPFWWNKKHPEECTSFADTKVDTTLKAGPPFHNEEHDIHAALRASLASQKWKQEAGQKLTEFCRKLAQIPEGNSIIGMHVAGGIYGEWHYWGFIDHEPDNGPAMTSYFRKWLTSKYKTTKAMQKAWQSDAYTLDNATVPGVAERMKTEDGFFKDPALEQRVIDYFTAQQQVVADDAEYFCRLVKQTWPRPLITGIFYGYLHMTFNRQTVGGHLFVRQILESPYIDYLSAPQTYWPDSRKAGGSGNSRGLIESTLLHGKLWLDEIDNGYLAKNDFENIRYTSRFDSSYANIMQRCTMLPLMRGIGFWLYDFGVQKGFGWWDDPAYTAAVHAQKKVFASRLTVPYHSEADVLYVWSQDVFYYLKSAPLPITVNVLDHSIEQAMRSGAVGDHIYDFDLERINPDQYKAIVFMNVYKLTDTQRKFIRQTLAKAGRTLVWNYLTGYTNGEKLDPVFVSELSGIAIQRSQTTKAPTVHVSVPDYSYTFSGMVDPVFTVKEKDILPLATLTETGQVIMARKTGKDGSSVYCGLPLNGTEGFRELFRQAGCHIYNEQNDFTYANSGVLMIHTKTAGNRRIRLKSGKTVTLSFEHPGTWLIDLSTGEVLLN